MKNLFRRPKSQSFAGTVIQSVFDHFNFPVVDVFQQTLLRHILPQQTIDVLIRPTLPTRNGPGKVARTPQRCINQHMSAELFAVVNRQTASDLLGTPLQAQQGTGFPPLTRARCRAGVAAVHGAFDPQ